MDMWLDKIKSAALAAALGLSACALLAAFAIIATAKNYAAPAKSVLAFIANKPIMTWPFGLTAFMLSSILGGGLVGYGCWHLFKNVKWTHRPRKLDSAESTADLLTKSATEHPRIYGGKFNGKHFFASVEDRGLVIGPPGTGKTTFLFNQILRAAKNGLSFVAVDMKPELYTTLKTDLEKLGYQVLRVNPAISDAGADHWNPLEDIDDEVDLQALCNSLLPIRDPKDAPFVSGQRDWLKAAVFHVAATPGGSLPSAFNLLSSHSEPMELLDIFINSPSETSARIGRRLYPGMAAGKDTLMLQSLPGCLRELDFLSNKGVQDAIGHSDFSVKDLGKGQQPTALFLQFEESKMAALGPLLAFMATGVLNSLISTVKERKAVALFLDELGNIPPIPNLPEKLNTIRSRNIPAWMYFQTTEQINRAYGHKADSVFFAAADVQIVFRLNDENTRQYFSKLIGTTEKYKFSSSKNGQSNNGMTRSREKINVIEPHQFGQLSMGEIVILYRGAAAKGVATPHYVDFPQYRRGKK